MNKPSGRIVFRRPAILGVALLAASCAAKIPVGKYDVLVDSSQRILTGTTETYTRITRLQRRFTVATVGSAPLTRESFKPVVDGQSFDLGPELQFREAALEVMVRYALVLQAFARHDFAGEVDKASEELAGSLKSLAATAAPDAGSARQASGVLATVVNVIGREVVRRQRLDALKTVMTSAQPDLAKLAELIAGSNAKIKQAVDIMLGRIVAHQNAVRPPPDSPMRFDFDTEVAAVIAEVEEIEAALAALSAAVAGVPPAHAEIRRMLDERPRDLTALQDLVKEVQRINRFYRSLK